MAALPLVVAMAVRASPQCETVVGGFGAGEAGEVGSPNFGQSVIPAAALSAVQVSGGIYHSAGLLEDGTIVCWGSNATPGVDPSGQGRVFGSNASGNPIASGQIGQRVLYFGQTLTNVVQVSCGELHTTALRANGTVVAWGSNNHQNLVIPSGLLASSIATGSLHTLALRPDGVVIGWGSQSTSGVYTGIQGIAAGYEHSLAWRSDGTAFAWGGNASGESSVPSSLGPTKQLDGGVRFSMSLGADGVVRAWGDNVGAQCGGTNGSGMPITSSDTGLRVVQHLGMPLTDVIAISAGGYHGTALRANGTVVAWGAAANPGEWQHGQVTVPASLAGRVVALDAGYLHTLALSVLSDEDCDANGRRDCVEIALGQASDADGDGILDPCEPIYFVPTDFETIQAAIDFVPMGSRKVVEVLAGTYNESFSLDGKDIVVRGAKGGATVLDGTGLPGSIARFAGGEPTTAGVESLVFRNGTTGSKLLPKHDFTVGGAIFGRDSDAFVRDCRFEDNRADFGGAVYLFGCGLDVEDCVFSGNEADVDAGGLFAFRCAGSVVGCEFTANQAGLFSTGSGSGFKAVGGRVPGATNTLEDCLFTGNSTNVEGAAIEQFEDTNGVPGILRIVGCTVTGNSSGGAVPFGAGGLRVIGRQSSCVLGGGTQICGNPATNVDGPYLIDGAATVCDCEADLTANGTVNAADLGVLLGAWGAVSADGAGDLTHDGLVNAADLAIMLSNWGSCGG